MKLETQRNILQVLDCTAAMPTGQGWTNLAAIVQWSGVSRQTVWRYLSKMQKLGLIEKDTRPFRHGEANFYRIKRRGEELLEAYKPLRPF